jgi:hypothetical protein
VYPDTRHLTSGVRVNKVLLSCLLFICAYPALSADDPQSSRFFLMAGGFWPDIDTTIRADGNGGRIGTQLDFESDLGLDDRDALPTAGAGMRLGGRHYIDVLYFKLARDGSHPIDIDISFRDQEFSRHTVIDSSFDTEVIRFSYGYAFIDNDKHLLMGQLGAHYTKVTAGLRRDNAGAVGVEATSDVPLPVIGLAYQYRFTPRLILDTRAQIFRLEYDNIEGALNNLSASLQFAFNRHFAAFVGYNYYSIDVDADADHWKGSFDFTYRGPWAGLTVGFGSGR